MDLLEGISRNGQAVLVGLNELNLTSDGYLQRLEVAPATAELKPRQTPPNAVNIQVGVTERLLEEVQVGSFLVTAYWDTDHLGSSILDDVQ